MTPLSGRRSQARIGGAAIEAEITAALHQLADETTARAAAVKARRQQEEASRHRYTRDELVGARAIRTRYGNWFAVVRINAKTVSVETGHSWVDRIPFDDVLEVRS